MHQLRLRRVSKVQAKLSQSAKDIVTVQMRLIDIGEQARCQLGAGCGWPFARGWFWFSGAKIQRAVLGWRAANDPSKRISKSWLSILNAHDFAAATSRVNVNGLQDSCIDRTKTAT